MSSPIEEQLPSSVLGERRACCLWCYRVSYKGVEVDRLSIYFLELKGRGAQWLPKPSQLEYSKKDLLWYHSRGQTTLTHRYRNGQKEYAVS